MTKITREWAMPSKHTFKIKPITRLLEKYVGDGRGWVDPFAGENSPAEVTNDLNPVKPAKFHRHALDFCQWVEGEFKGVLFDPPYSPRQIQECYHIIGIKPSQEDTQQFSVVKRIIAPKIRPAGYAITFGWNSNGFGKKLGFEPVEILIVAHGANHNDTIVTVERKSTNVSK